MTEIRKTYTDLLNELSGADWAKDKKEFRIGHAGAAIVVAFLHNGELKLKTLAENIPDFSQSELRIALKRLKENGYFSYEDRKDGKRGYVLQEDKDAGIDSTIWWGLLINVAQGYIERAD